MASPRPTASGPRRDWFRAFSHRTADIVGSPWAFFASIVIVLVWAATGPVFRYSDTWQLIINTGTTILTFLMVFLIQNTQNRDAKAIHLKLDELIRGVDGARTKLVQLEGLSDDELANLEKQFTQLRERLPRHEEPTRPEPLAHDEHPPKRAA